jgi:hypothetical protein
MKNEILYEIIDIVWDNIYSEYDKGVYDLNKSSYIENIRDVLTSFNKKDILIKLLKEEPELGLLSHEKIEISKSNIHSVYDIIRINLENKVVNEIEHKIDNYYSNSYYSY